MPGDNEPNDLIPQGAGAVTGVAGNAPHPAPAQPQPGAGVPETRNEPDPTLIAVQNLQTVYYQNGGPARDRVRAQAEAGNDPRVRNGVERNPPAPNPRLIPAPALAQS